MDRNRALELLKTYGEAWEKRDPEMILQVFTEDAVYRDPHEPIATGHDGIRAYWKSKVVGEQDDIRLELLGCWIDGDTVIAEWHAEFTDTRRRLRIDMTEVAVFTARDNRFSSLREYYDSRKTALADSN